MSQRPLLPATFKLEARPRSTGASALGEHLGRGGGFGRAKAGFWRWRMRQGFGASRWGSEAFWSRARRAGDRGVTAVHNKLPHDAGLPAHWLSEWQPHDTCKIFFSQSGLL